MQSNAHPAIKELVSSSSKKKNKLETQAHLTASSNRQNNSRPEANFPPSLWGCSFASFSFPQTVNYFSSIYEFESYSRKVEVLKENVKDMLMASKKDTVEHIEFINLYEDQIQKSLEWGDIDEVEIDEEENSDSGANDSDGGSADSDAVDEDLMASDTNNDAITGNEVAVTGEAEAAADAAVIGDEDVVTAAEAELMNDTSNAAEGIMVSDTSIAEGSITRSSSRLQQKPRWMSDYVCSHQRYEEENEINMAVMQVNDGIIQLLHCRTQEQIADLMTKALKVETFQKLREELGVCKIE
ncbi:hypothetical protein POTOM_058781 [Populus tomentosa]|uniref:Uncharacterized protein n=1 Tax=Populus tomentosa TaxID=118781 RepID=A0A8X7XUZ5_POPTO|nr:hypothetical protein POTOM_058781 [Populus tomentosa]